MTMVKAHKGDACRSCTVDGSLASGAPGVPAPYIGLCCIFSDSIDAFQAGFGRTPISVVRHRRRRTHAH